MKIKKILKGISRIILIGVSLLSFSFEAFATREDLRRIPFGDTNYYEYRSDYNDGYTDVERAGLLINKNSDPDIPRPMNVNINADGEVTWEIEDTGPSGNKYIYKKFEIQLMKRQYVEASGAVDAHYEYKDSGGVKSFNISSEDLDDYYAHMAISTPGYYIVRVRAYTFEARYSFWGWSYDENASAFESNSTNITVTNGAQTQYIYGPGTQNYTGQTYNSMQVQSPYVNQYGQQGNPYYYYGGNYMPNQAYDPNQLNQYVYQNGQMVPYQNYAYTNQAQAQASVGVGPGYASANSNQGGSTQGPGAAMQAFTPTVTASGYGIQTPIQGQYGGTAQIIPTAPGQAAGTNNMGAGNISQVGPGGVTTSSNNNLSTEVGWHNDNNGIYYYLGNGTYLRDQWYQIDNNYYRFDGNGYVMTNKWFKDPTNSGWYYLGADGKMTTGWTKWENKWYFLNPQKGTYYGVMYANCSLPIDGKYYAFNEQGECVMNNTYGGYYYGADGARQG